jgi:hypothetical protein
MHIQIYTMNKILVFHSQSDKQKSKTPPSYLTAKTKELLIKLANLLALHQDQHVKTCHLSKSLSCGLCSFIGNMT